MKNMIITCYLAAIFFFALGQWFRLKKQWVFDEAMKEHEKACDAASIRNYTDYDIHKAKYESLISDWQSM